MFSPTKPSKTNHEKKTNERQLWPVPFFIDKSTPVAQTSPISCISTSLLGAGRMLMGSGTRFLCFYTWVARLYFVLAIKFHFPLFRLAIVLVCWKYRSGHRQSLTPTRNMLFEGRTPQRSPASTLSSVFFGRLLFGTWLKQLQKASRQDSPLNFLKDWHAPTFSCRLLRSAPSLALEMTCMSWALAQRCLGKRMAGKDFVLLCAAFFCFLSFYCPRFLAKFHLLWGFRKHCWYFATDLSEDT